VVPRFVSAALAGRPLTIHGTGRQTRCFADIADVVDALVALLTRPEAVGGVYNVGGDRETSINDLADLVLRITAGRSSKQYVPLEQAYARPFEDAQRRVPDISRITALLGRRPRVPLEESIRRTADFLCANPGAAD
jgi:UDP-glucose 4-epimerase